MSIFSSQGSSSSSNSPNPNKIVSTLNCTIEEKLQTHGFSNCEGFEGRQAQLAHLFYYLRWGPSRLIRAFLNYSIKSGISNNVWCKKHIRGLPLVAFGTTNAIKFALSLVDVVGYQSPVSPWAHLQHEGSEQLRPSPAGCWRRTMALLLSSSTSAPGWTSAALFAMICQCSLPSCWQMSCQIMVYRVYECMNSSHTHLASPSHLWNF